MIERTNLSHIRHIVDTEIEQRKAEPIDLLGLGDAEGEYIYLLRQRNAYVRTVADLYRLLHYHEQDATRILEIGAYLGIVSTAASKLGFQVDAFELHEFCHNERLQALYARNGVRLSPGDLSEYRLPFEDGTFDAVVMCETLEHLNFNPLPVIREINRVTRMGGVIYIAMPNGACLNKRLRLLCGQSVCNPIGDYFYQVDQRYNMKVGLHWREYMAYETQEMLEGIGYEVIETYFFESADLEPRLRLRRRLGKVLRDLWPALRHDQIVVGRKRDTPNFEHWRV